MTAAFTAAAAAGGESGHRTDVLLPVRSRTCAAAHGTARDPFRVHPERALEALRLEWGFAYDPIYYEGLFCAQRVDGSGQPVGEPLSGETPDELVRKLEQDWGETA